MNAYNLKPILVSLVLVSLVAGASISSKNRSIANYLGHANLVSQTFAKGDNGDVSGWRSCILAEETKQLIGVLCEGVRTVDADIGESLDLNYFCEFQFKPIGESDYQLTYELCQ